MKKILLILIFLNSYNAMSIVPILRISYDLNLKLSYSIGACISNDDIFDGSGGGYFGPYYMFSKSIFQKSSTTSMGFQFGAGGWASSQIGINIMNLIRADNSNDIYYGLEFNVHPLFVDLKTGLMFKEPFERITDLKINTSIGLGI